MLYAFSHRTTLLSPSTVLLDSQQLTLLHRNCQLIYLLNMGHRPSSVRVIALFQSQGKEICSLLITLHRWLENICPV